MHQEAQVPLRFGPGVNVGRCEPRVDVGGCERRTYPWPVGLCLFPFTAAWKHHHPELQLDRSLAGLQHLEGPWAVMRSECWALLLTAGVLSPGTAAKLLGRILSSAGKCK